MKRFKNLLLLDPGPTRRPAAFARARSLAQANDARLTVVGSAVKVPADLAEIVSRRKGLDLARTLENEERERLDAWVGGLPAGGPPVSVRILPRDSARSILKEVDRGSHDLLMLVAEGEVGGWFGSTATHLFRKSGVPVWVLKPQPQPRYRRIIASVDRDPMPGGRDELNLKILQLASSLAAAEESELHVAHSWTLVGESLLRNRVGMRSEEISAIGEETRQAREDWLTSLLLKVPEARVSAKLHLARGTPHVAIPDLVEELDADLIVMGTLGRSGLAGALIGNTAERILNRVHCAVLAVKPDGFRSPIGGDKETAAGERLALSTSP